MDDEVDNSGTFLSMETYPESPSSETSSSEQSSSTDGSSCKEGEDGVSLESSPLPYNTPHPIPKTESPYPRPEMDNSYAGPIKSRHQILPERVFSKGNKFSAVLDTIDLWKQFNEIGTEMIVTRRGR